MTQVRRRLSTSYGSTVAGACTVPGMHAKYVLAAASEAESREWQAAVEAHVAFALALAERFVAQRTAEAAAP